MATTTTLPKLTVEQRRAASGQFERANQVLKGGDHEYGLQLLLECCKIDPANLIYRQALRQSQRAWYQYNEKGQPFAYLRSIWTRFSLKKAMLRGEFREALVLCELVFMRNPWDLSVHLIMAEAFQGLTWHDHALWTLEQIRPFHAKDVNVNRPLARLYERRGNFNQAIALWEMVHKIEPDDPEACRKAKDLAASATIAKGRYEEAVKEETSKAVNVDDETSAERPALGKTAEVVMPVQRQSREIEQQLERIQKNPKNANGYLQLAHHYRKADQLDKARDVLKQGMEATANHFEIVQAIFDLDIEPFRRDLAVTEEQLRTSPSDKELLAIREKLTKEINTRELEYHRRRSDRYPTDTAARFEMGLRLLRAGQSDEAIKELQSIRTDPRFHGQAVFYLGLCFQSRKNWRLAQRNFEEALQHLGPSESFLRKETMYLLAVGYAGAGELERAIDLGCELANLDFNYKNIGSLLDEWQAKAPAK
jgi:tetratricopeptide (TPR) repeat protein